MKVLMTNNGFVAKPRQLARLYVAQAATEANFGRLATIRASS